MVERLRKAFVWITPVLNVAHLRARLLKTMASPWAGACRISIRRHRVEPRLFQGSSALEMRCASPMLASQSRSASLRTWGFKAWGRSFRVGVDGQQERCRHCRGRFDVSLLWHTSTRGCQVILRIAIVREGEHLRVRRGRWHLLWRCSCFAGCPALPSGIERLLWGVTGMIGSVSLLARSSQVIPGRSRGPAPTGNASWRGVAGIGIKSSCVVLLHRGDLLRVYAACAIESPCAAHMPACSVCASRSFP